MENKYAKAMTQRTDEELISIVTIERKGYELLAVEAAEHEIRKRGITIENIQAIENELNTNQNKVNFVNKNTVSGGIRFLNFIIDFIVWLVLFSIISLPLTYTYDSSNLVFALVLNLLMLTTYILYYYLLESNYQKSIGKFITKTKVVKLDGEKPNTTDIFYRSIYGLIPFDRLSFIIMKNGFHDRFSNTKVVREQEK